jgi:hypothetical protein
MGGGGGGSFDLSVLRVPQVKVPAGPPACERKRPAKDRIPLPGRVNGEFLGPCIPLVWLGPACKWGGKVLNTALAIWFLAGLRGRRNDLKLTAGIANRFHVSPAGKCRALKKLEGEGLVRVERQPRKTPRVTILFPDAGDAGHAA